MYFAQLDGEITNKQSQELLDKEYKKAIELENKNKEQKLEKQHPFYTDKEKVVLFLYTFLTFQCEGYFLLSKTC